MSQTLLRKNLWCYLLICLGAHPAVAQTDGLLFDEPASSLDESYRGKYGNGEKIEGPYLDKSPEETQQREHSQDETQNTKPNGLLSLGIGLTSGFTLDLSYTYFYNRYIANEYGLNYDLELGRSEGARTRAESYGPRLIFYFLLANPTFFTPFVGAGPSFEIWNRKFGELASEHNQSLIANSLVGANLQLSRYFILQLAVVGKSYLFERPKAFNSNSELEPSFQRALQLRFLLQF